MQIKFLPVGGAPDGYTFNGDILTAAVDPLTETFDFSTLEYGGSFEGVVVDTLPLDAAHIIRSAERDANGELWLTLCQKAGSGHWVESGWMDASAYVASETYITRIG